MTKKLVTFLLPASAVFLLGASLLTALSPGAKAANFNGNKTFNTQGVQIGCVTVQTPYNCTWNNLTC